VNVLPNAPGPFRPGAYDLPFLDSTVETPTATTFRFSTEGSGFSYRSNQAIRLVLPGVQDPWGPARSFSLSSSPSEEGRIAVTAKMTGSPYKEGLRRLEPGEVVRVIGPLGDLLYNPNRASLFIAGGIGITPFRGMMRYAADTGVRQPIVLLYSARVPEEFAFRTELDAIVEKNPQFEVRYTVTRPGDAKTAWKGRIGRIGEPWIREALERLERPKVYVAGLPEMAQEVLATLRERFGVDEDDLEYEYFLGY
jgi:ferredoxin-NADP reductase